MALAAEFSDQVDAALTAGGRGALVDVVAGVAIPAQREAVSARAGVAADTVAAFVSAPAVQSCTLVNIWRTIMTGRKSKQNKEFVNCN